MSKNKTELQRTKERNAKLVQMVKDAREQEAQYKELGGIYASYIGLLLEKLGATEENPVVITREAVKDAMGKQNVKVKVEDGVFQLWVE